MSLTLGLTVASAVVVAAQDEESEASSQSYTTGTAGALGSFVEPTEEEGPDGQRQMRGTGLIDIPLELDDPRLSGLLTIPANGTGQSFANIESRSYRIANDDGAWAGSRVQVIAAGEVAPMPDPVAAG